MKINRILVLVFLAFGMQTVNSQTDLEAITSTLMDYIEGTANGQPDRVTNAFHPELNLYSISDDDVKVWFGKEYISGIKKGQKSNRIGRIVSIDYENNAAMAKIEILMPNAKRVYTDYLMLLKYQSSWKIIHKSYTFVPYPE